MANQGSDTGGKGRGGGLQVSLTLMSYKHTHKLAWAHTHKHAQSHTHPHIGTQEGVSACVGSRVRRGAGVDLGQWKEKRHSGMRTQVKLGCLSVQTTKRHSHIVVYSILGKCGQQDPISTHISFNVNLISQVIAKESI